MDLSEKDYIVVLQCDIAKEHCPGYACEKAFRQRTGGFAVYSAEKDLRMLSVTCGGCIGRATHRKVGSLVRALNKDGIGRERLIVQLASCITKNNYHSPRCPHVDDIEELLRRLDVEFREDTVISEISEKRRGEGVYPAEKP